MSKSFTDYVYRRLLSEVEDVGAATEAPAPGEDTVAEKKQKVKNVQAGFAQAREELSKMVDAKFAELEGQLQRSFGSQQKINSVDRAKIVQVLGKIADKINSWGDSDQDVQYAAPAAEQVPTRVPPVAAEGIRAVNGLLIEAELYVEDNHGMKIQSVKSYLQKVKAEIMQQVDNTLRALQNDAVMKMMNDIHKSVSTVQGIVSGQSPLNATEKIDAYHNLQQLGNTIAMSAAPKLKFGERLPKSTSPVQIILGGGHVLNFNPSDRDSIQAAMGKLRNPRAVKIKVGDRVETVDISNKQQMADIISAAQEAMEMGGQQLAAANKVAAQPNDPLKAARQPRKKMFPTPAKPSMPVALGPGVGE
jgi:hypothetical protein